MKDNVILIGMPGCGKSTVGVLLAKAIGYGFIDTDIVIQNREGRLLQDIIDSEGIERFLDAEQEAILSIEPSRCVAATGGSAVMRERSMEHLKGIGTVVYIETALDELMRRIDNITTRGIAIAEGQTLADVYALRAPLYEKYADVTVRSDGDSVEDTVEKVIFELKRKKSV